MSANTVKIFDDNHEYITLAALAKTQKYSLEYLLTIASGGKLKSFKIGDDWLTTLAWFDDYQKSVKQSIQLEIIDKTTNQKKDWVDFWPENNWQLKFWPQLFLVLAIFSIFSFSLSWLVASSSGHQFARSTHDFTDQKYVVGDYFLDYTARVYGYSNNYFSFLFDNSLDSVDLLADSALSVGRDTTYLALALDQHIGSYKISDEVLTEKFNELANIVKAKYQAVAGVSTVRQQIYFDEWQNSTQADN